MIDPPLLAFRRRAAELRAAALRELPFDVDTSALLLFYAVECALKYLYMAQYALKSAGESRAGVASAREMNHDLVRILNALQVPRSSIHSSPPYLVRRTSSSCSIVELHQAWRYGERIDDTSEAWGWLNAVYAYCEARL